MPAKLKNGNVGAPGGAREGAGRPADWLRSKCQEIVKKKKLIEFLADVASGEFMENVFDGSNKTGLMRSADAKDRMKATEMLLDRGYGKAIQGVDLDPKGTGGNLVVVLPK